MGFYQGFYYISAGGAIMVAGCPFDWCSEIPKIHVEQFMVGYVFALLGYPFCVALCGALFSKVLGPIPQVSKSASPVIFSLIFRTAAIIISFMIYG